MRGTRKSLQFRSFAKHKTKWTDIQCHTSLCDDKMPTNSNTVRITFRYASPPHRSHKILYPGVPTPYPTKKIPCNFHVCKIVTTQGLPTWILKWKQRGWNCTGVLHNKTLKFNVGKYQNFHCALTPTLLLILPQGHTFVLVHFSIRAEFANHFQTAGLLITDRNVTHPWVVPCLRPFNRHRLNSKARLEPQASP